MSGFVVGVRGDHVHEPLTGLIALAFGHVELHQGKIGLQRTGPGGLGRLNGLARSGAVAAGS